ncbi:protein YhfH [Priestia endophytica]|uniref:YhfH family protein n=1 Tax=Priestia endophytica TaxID=135735 RepID=A0AAX1Q6R5_9BACI|nr:protein YhfH [Priestia endophytica]RAS72438.1 YhfH family protein [Priestia endophytica]RAS90076.1 YhfH family protein [Priestia endophytica]
MTEKITEFFRNLPPKRCRDCGNAIEEQHECYGNTCNKCLNIK